MTSSSSLSLITLSELWQAAHHSLSSLSRSYDKQLTGSYDKQLITLSLPLSLRLDRTGRFVTGSYDKQLITWQVNKSEPEAIVEGERVTDLAVSKDGRRLVMMTADKKIQMFALPSMAPLARAAAICEVMLEVMLVYTPPTYLAYQFLSCDKGVCVGADETRGSCFAPLTLYSLLFTLYSLLFTLYSLLFTRLATPRLLSYCFTRAVERQGSIAPTYSISFSSHSIWDLTQSQEQRRTLGSRVTHTACAQRAGHACMRGCLSASLPLP
jgi:hypothetical protein